MTRWHSSTEACGWFAACYTALTVYIDSSGRGWAS